MDPRHIKILQIIKKLYIKKKSYTPFKSNSNIKKMFLSLFIWSFGGVFVTLLSFCTFWKRY